MSVVGKVVIVVMPAYNASKTLLETYNDIPKEFVDEIILVDDNSRDDTVGLAKKIGIKTFIHPRNIGYGGNQKTCYREALKAGAEIVVMLHPDYQYDPKKIPQIIAPIVEGRASLVLGSRIMGGGALSGGMPPWKYIANRFLTFIMNLVLKKRLSEYHTGYRAYSKEFLETIPLELNSNDFVFDAEIIIQCVNLNFKIDEIEISTIYRNDSSCIDFISSLRYGFGILRASWQYILHKNGLVRQSYLMRQQEDCSN